LKLFVGIDVSSQELQACLMNPDGEKLDALKVKNDLQGASHLRDRIVATADKLSASEIHIGLESTSVYSWHPAMYLHQDPALKALGAKVFTINPKLISKFKEAYPDLDKTDRLDAWIIADRLRFGRLTTTIVMQEQYIALQRLTRMRYHLIHSLTREKQYFLQNLFYKCNAFTSEVESSVFGHAILEMLSEKYSLDDIATMDVADLADYLNQSGSFEAEDTKRIRSGNRFLRYYLVEAANSVKNREPEFGEYYRKKYQEVPRHQHKRALVLTARKLVRLVDALLRNDQLYTPRRKVNHAKG